RRYHAPQTCSASRPYSCLATAVRWQWPAAPAHVGWLVSLATDERSGRAIGKEQPHRCGATPHRLDRARVWHMEKTSSVLAALSPRARRAVALIALATVAIAGASTYYLRPWVVLRAASNTASIPSPPAREQGGWV